MQQQQGIDNQRDLCGFKIGHDVSRQSCKVFLYVNSFLALE